MHSPYLVLLAGLVGPSLAHGNHGGSGSQKPIVSSDADWMTKHMAEEHHAHGFDAASFFTLHDFNGDGYLDADELLRTYGLMDESNKHVAQHRVDEIAHELLDLLDADHDGHVSRAEWDDFIRAGHLLPDMGTGPGHHGDDEYEYEIHHWEKYHDENTRLEDLTHPEDIEHFKKHERLDREEETQRKFMEQKAVVDENVPAMFRRHH
ncbi:hypothetical protein GGTG_04381 [Gaeumannomyces tritici R3-111a-1]|uniref:EF-hand domain-containing protein n=1 Tax=Gaeumannomyces tritici (strain R3-111a-1) TaxID=644352 RepID=J3NSY2_GAET3|nr:hypothetical protein GGTG_04381 [Gaeumannomyces tritici R3-111a-1]EJT79295.1 hypothetical protein GGTG_04381 [Gaeumannomyces tritici R3-111a-1]